MPAQDAVPKIPRPVTPMSLIVAQLARLAEQAEALNYTDAAFTDALKQVSRLAKGLDAYVEACTSPESADLAELTKNTQREDWAARYDEGDTAAELEQEMLSGHVEGQFLKMLVHAAKAKRVLEIGLFTGYSSLAMAEALPDDGALLALELDGFAAEFAQRQFASSAHHSKIRVDVGPAMDSLRNMAGAAEPFDLIFIDADKGGYSDYLDAIVDGSLLAPGGIVCVDNTLMQGMPYSSDTPTVNGQAIAAFNKTLVSDNRFEQVLLPIRDGITLIRQI